MLVLSRLWNAVKLNINKSLKPEPLLATHNPTEFKQWARQFKAYYRSSNMEILEIPDQQIYLQSCVEAKLFSRIYTKVGDNTPIFDDTGANDSCMNYLLQDLQERWPLFNRRLAFF